MVKRHHVRAHGMRQLDAHVAQAADADHADRVPRSHLPVAQRRVGGDARAQQRRDGGQLCLGVTDAQDVALVHHDLLGIPAERVARRVRRRPVVGADHVVAVVLQPRVAVLAALAAIDDAADADQIAHLEAGHLRAHR